MEKWFCTWRNGLQVGVCSYQVLARAAAAGGGGNGEMGFCLEKWPSSWSLWCPATAASRQRWLLPADASSGDGEMSLCLEKWPPSWSAFAAGAAHWTPVAAGAAHWVPAANCQVLANG